LVRGVKNDRLWFVYDLDAEGSNPRWSHRERVGGWRQIPAVLQIAQQVRTWGQPNLAETSRQISFGLAFAYFGGEDPFGTFLNDVPAPSGHLP